MSSLRTFRSEKKQICAGWFPCREGRVVGVGFSGYVGGLSSVQDSKHFTHWEPLRFSLCFLISHWHWSSWPGFRCDVWSASITLPRIKELLDKHALLTNDRSACKNGQDMRHVATVPRENNSTLFRQPTVCFIRNVVLGQAHPAVSDDCGSQPAPRPSF